ncbi:hypothetical protein D9M68_790060 [compost metagenome]
MPPGLLGQRFKQGEALVGAALIATYAGVCLIDDDEFRTGLREAGTAAICLDVVEADNGEGMYRENRITGRKATLQ